VAEDKKSDRSEKKSLGYLLRDSKIMNHKDTKTPRELKADNPLCLGVRAFF
jgi:hypothetical protein